MDIRILEVKDLKFFFVIILFPVLIRENNIFWSEYFYNIIIAENETEAKKILLNSLPPKKAEILKVLKKQGKAESGYYKIHFKKLKNPDGKGIINLPLSIRSNLKIDDSEYIET